MLLEPNCVKRNCGHYAGVDQPDGTESSERHVCLAFPNGIPERIAYGPDLHRVIADDQVGQVVFEIDDLPDGDDGVETNVVENGVVESVQVDIAEDDG